jgi:hypothetical protein
MERFLCDEMLARLCRYLRAAGYDAALARDGIRDRDLLRQCQEETRRFLTLDRRIHEHKAAVGVVVLLHTSRLEEQAQVLANVFGLDWRSLAALSTIRPCCPRPRGSVHASPGCRPVQINRSPPARAAAAFTGVALTISGCARSWRRGSSSALPACIEPIVQRPASSTS